MEAPTDELRRPSTLRIDGALLLCSSTPSGCGRSPAVRVEVPERVAGDRIVAQRYEVGGGVQASSGRGREQRERQGHVTVLTQPR